MLNWTAGLNIARTLVNRSDSLDGSYQRKFGTNTREILWTRHFQRDKETPSN